MGKRDSDVWLDEDDYLGSAPATNTQVHINHIGCPAGIDRKRRLYIKRTAKGVVAFCHHCGKKGASMLTPLAKSWEQLNVDGNLESVLDTQRGRESALVWVDASHLGMGCSALLDWLTKKHIPDIDIRDVSPVIPRVGTKELGPFDILYLPIVGDLPGGPELCGIQTRNFNAHYTGPKYITDIWAKAPPWVYRAAGASLDTVCLTEDWASAVYLGANGLPAVPLYGTSCNDETLLHLAKTKGVKNLAVWLDNDNPEVIKAAESIARRAALVFSGCHCCTVLPAPTALDSLGVRIRTHMLREHFA